jgi:hypothetical protein
MAGLKQISRMRESIVEEIVRGFSTRHQAEAFGLLAQALLMEALHRSSTEYARGWLTVMHKIIDGDLDGAAHGTAELAKLQPTKLEGTENDRGNLPELQRRPLASHKRTKRGAA